MVAPNIYTPVDFVIVCALDQEVNALCKVFQINPQERTRITGSLSYWSTIYKDKHIRIVDLDEKQGVLHAATVSMEVLINWEPWCIVSFGIAGRTVSDDEKIKIGDVILGEQVNYYEPSKVVDISDENTAGIIHNGDSIFETDSNEFKNTLDDSNLGFKTSYSSILSGEKKIASRDSGVIKKLSDSHRKYIAVEMEAAGVGGAAKKVGNTKFLVVKGVSDNAGEDELETTREDKKIKRQRKENRETACLNAAKCLAEIIKNTTPSYTFITEANHESSFERSERFLSSITNFIDLNETHRLLSLNNPIFENTTATLTLASDRKT